MAGRRPLLFVLLLLLIGAGASIIAPRERASKPPPAETEATPPTPPAKVVKGRMPGDRTVDARVGELVRLDVSHDALDVVQITALGISEPVGPDVGAQLVFDADRPGRFAVTLRYAEKRIGTVVVAAAR